MSAANSRSSMEEENNNHHQSINLKKLSSTRRESNNNVHRCRLPPIGDVPWLVYTHGNSTNKKKIQTFCTIPDNSNSNHNNNVVYIKSIPELRGKRICAFNHGWLVVRDLDNGKMISLWNVVTSQSLDLPPLPYLPVSDENDDEEEREVKLSSCTFTSPLILCTDTETTTTACVLVLFFQDQVFWCRPTLSHNASINWFTRRLDRDGNRIKVIHSLVFDGIIYSWATVYEAEGGAFRYLVSMKVVDEDLILLPLQLEPPKCGYGCIHVTEYLVESCGLLYCVIVSVSHMDDDKISFINVWELDFQDTSWVEVKCLNGRAFFLEKFGCTWCWGSDNEPVESSSSSSSSGVVGVKGNYVYFIHEYYEILCAYSLAEKNVTEFQTCRNLQTPITSVTWLNLTPQHHRLPATQYREELDRMNNKEEKVGDDETQGRESLLISKLPNDMILLISEYLHLFDYGNFRASCKTFQSIILPLPEKRTYNLLPVPLFICFKNDDGLCQMIDPSRNSYSCNHLQLSSYEPDPFSVDFSKDGWLVVSNPAWKSLEFLNPFTTDWWNFPFDDDQFVRDSRSVGFSTDPNSPDCVTVIFDIGGDERVPIHYIQHGDETWMSCDFDNQEDKFWPGISSPIYFAGAFYVLGIDGRLGEFKVIEDEEEETWKVYGSPAIQDERLHSYHLMECGEKLLAVFIGYMGKWVQVFKFNLSKLKWIKVESLGSYSLFISNPSSFSAQPIEVGMRNRIYVPRLKGNSMIFYSLDTGKFHVSGSEDDSFEDLFGTTEPLHCFWF